MGSCLSAQQTLHFPRHGPVSLGEQIAEGGFSFVFLASDRKGQYAVKVWRSHTRTRARIYDDLYQYINIFILWREIAVYVLKTCNGL